MRIIIPPRSVPAEARLLEAPPIAERSGAWAPAVPAVAPVPTPTVPRHGASAVAPRYQSIAQQVVRAAQQVTGGATDWEIEEVLAQLRSALDAALTPRTAAPTQTPPGAAASEGQAGDAGAAPAGGGTQSSSQPAGRLEGEATVPPISPNGPTASTEARGESNSHRPVCARAAPPAAPQEAADDIIPRSPCLAAVEHAAGHPDGAGDPSKAFDDALAELQRATPQPHAEGAASPYERARLRHARAIEAMVSDVGNALLRSAMPAFEGHYRSGTFDLGRAIQAQLRAQMTGSDAADVPVFLRRSEPRAHDTAIVLCVDISGSMAGAAIAAARDAYVVFREALRELDIPAGVVAYNNEAVVLVDMCRDRPSDDDAAFDRLVAGGSNNEPDALRLAQEMLDSSSATSRLIFFITDGGAVADCKDAVEDLERSSDIRVVGVGIGHGCAEVPLIYSRHVVVAAVEALPREMGCLLESTLCAESA